MTTIPRPRLLRELNTSERLQTLRRSRAAGHLPYFRSAESLLGPEVVMEGVSRVMLGSPNYLGFADHPAVMGGARAALDEYGTSLTGSRILNGSTRLHHELEAEIADWHGTEGALVFTTGYQTNLGTVSALVGPGDTVVADAYAHASLHDGARLSGAKVRGFRHNRLDLFEDTLRRAARDGGRILVLLDGIYSMEGDLNPLDEMIPMCWEHDAAVMLDEAHSVGVLGERGTGAAELFALEDEIDVRMGALSKALSSVGGYIAGDSELLDYLRVNSRAFVFTTVGVPAAMGAALAAIRLRRTQEGAERVESLRRHSRYLRAGLEEQGFELGPTSDDWDRTSPIISVFMGDSDLAMMWWKELYDRKVFVGVALHPGVPHCGALLRVCPMATHEQAHIDYALDVFGLVGQLLSKSVRA